MTSLFNADIERLRIYLHAFTRANRIALRSSNKVSSQKIPMSTPSIDCWTRTRSTDSTLAMTDLHRQSLYCPAYLLRSTVRIHYFIAMHSGHCYCRLLYHFVYAIFGGDITLKSFYICYRSTRIWLSIRWMQFRNEILIHIWTISRTKFRCTTMPVGCWLFCKTGHVRLRIWKVACWNWAST